MKSMGRSIQANSLTGSLLPQRMPSSSSSNSSSSSSIQDVLDDQPSFGMLSHMRCSEKDIWTFKALDNR
jgi:hypothetical protein